MPDVFTPQLPPGSSFTPNPQNVEMLKNLAGSLGVMVQESQKQQQYGHESAIVEQIASGRPVTGTRPQAPQTGLQRLTAPFNPNAPYTGRQLPIEAEYKLAPIRERQAERKLERETAAKLKVEAGKLKLKGPPKIDPEKQLKANIIDRYNAWKFQLDKGSITPEQLKQTSTYPTEAELRKVGLRLTPLEMIKGKTYRGEPLSATEKDYLVKFGKKPTLYTIDKLIDMGFEEDEAEAYLLEQQGEILNQGDFE